MTQITTPGAQTAQQAVEPTSDLSDRIRDILEEQQPRHLRRTTRWWRRLGAGSSTRGRSRGATFGTPSTDLAEAPPSAAQEANVVVSGGGVVRRDGRSPAHRASRIG